MFADRDVLVLKSITACAEDTLQLDVWPEELDSVQQAVHDKIDKELQEMNSRIDLLVKQSGAQILYQGEACSAYQIGEPPSLAYTGMINR